MSLFRLINRLFRLKAVRGGYAPRQMQKIGNDLTKKEPIECCHLEFHPLIPYNAAWQTAIPTSTLFPPE